jgi:hypothetical protein
MKDATIKPWVMITVITQGLFVVGGFMSIFLVKILSITMYVIFE